MNVFFFFFCVYTYNIYIYTFIISNNQYNAVHFPSFSLRHWVCLRMGNPKPIGSASYFYIYISHAIAILVVYPIFRHIHKVSFGYMVVNAYQYDQYDFFNQI